MLFSDSSSSSPDEPHAATNARTEGFNGKAKLVIRRAYGYKSFRNYRLRLLNSCA
jgi:transposase